MNGLLRWYRSIAARLTGVFVLFVIAPTLLLSGVTYYFGSQALRQAATEKLESAIALKERSIATWFTEARSFIQVIAQDAQIAEHGVNLLVLHGSDPSYAHSYEKVLRRLESIRATMPDLMRISILSDVGGREVLSTDPNYVGRFHLTDSFFTLGREGTYVQKVYFSERGETAVMIVATPMHNADGEIVGVLYVALDPEFLNAIMLERSGLGETGETYVVDTRHKLVTDVRGQAPPRAQELHTVGIDAALDRKKGDAVYANYEGRQVIGFYRWLEEPKLALVAEVQLSEALAPIENLKHLILWAIVGITFVSLVVSWLVAREISHPVRAVAEAAKRVAQGDLNQHAPVLTRDEIGDLSQCFNSMTDALRETELEKANAFAELENTNQNLVAATAAKNTFLANMSHELRTPLNAIIGYSEMLKDDAVESKRLESIPDLERIQTAGRHLLSLIDDVLDLTRIESGNVSLDAEAFALQPFLSDLVEIAEPLMKQRSNTLQVIFPDSLGTMTGDPTRLRQILLNLLGNAAKFTDNGQVTLAVEKIREGDSSMVRFRVRDTGIGIAADQLSRIFQEFVQGDLSATRRFGGAGLGLAITKRFCEMMGGRVSVTSTLGKGSEFVVEIPEQRIARSGGHENVKSA